MNTVVGHGAVATVACLIHCKILPLKGIWKRIALQDNKATNSDHDDAITCCTFSTTSYPINYAACDRNFANFFFFASAQRRIYSDVFAKWPKQDLRPDYQLQDVLGKTVDARFQSYTPAKEREEILRARALQFLVQDKFKDRVCAQQLPWRKPMASALLDPAC